jgi:hypothetical protein
MSVMLVMLRIAAFWAMEIRVGAGMVGCCCVGRFMLDSSIVGGLLYEVVKLGQTHTKLVCWIVRESFVNKGGVEVGIRRQRDGFRAGEEEGELTSEGVAVAAWYCGSQSIVSSCEVLHEWIWS